MTVLVANIAVIVFILVLHAPEPVTALEVFRDYGEPDLSVSQIDLEVRSIQARTALASPSGLEQAKQIYESGSGRVPGVTLEGLTINLYRDHAVYQAATNFYGGEQNYISMWTDAAFDTTNLVLGGNERRTANFYRLDAEGRSIAVRWGTLVLNLWMYTIGKLEEALSQVCENSNDNFLALNNWDTAFAFYTGSLAENENPLGGYLFYHLAQIQCQEFGTCKRGEEAPVNTQILAEFLKGKQNIQMSSCAGLQANVQKITSLMTVPLIQTTLRTAYDLDLHDDTRSEIQGEAAAFGAALAPLISQCSQGSADIVFHELAPGNAPQASYEVIKFNLERHYGCLGLACNDVGGLIDFYGNYLHRAEACDNAQPVRGSSGSAGFAATRPKRKKGGTQIFGIVLVVMGAAALAVCVGRSANKEMDTSDLGGLNLTTLPPSKQVDIGENNQTKEIV